MLDLLFGIVVIGALGTCYARPGAAVGLLLSGFALEQCAQAFVPLAGRNNSLVNYILALFVAIATLRQVLRFGVRVLFPRGPMALSIVFLAYCYLTVTWSIFPSVTENILLESLPYVLVFVGLAPLTVQSEQDLNDAFFSLVIATTTTFLLLILFAEWGGRSVYLPYGDFYSNPLALTQAAGASLICVTLSPVLRRLPRPLGLPFALVTLSVVLVAFVRTGSRGQIVSSIATVLFFVAITKRGIWFLPVALSSIALLGTSLFEDEVRANRLRWSGDQMRRDLTEDRIGSAQQLFEYWSSSDPLHVLFGLGNSISYDPRILGGYPHVVPVEVLCEEGIVGALLFAACIGLSVHYAIKAGLSSNGLTRQLFTTVLALMLYEFLLTLKQGSLLGSRTFLTLVSLPSSFVVLSRILSIETQGETRGQALHRTLAPSPASKRPGRDRSQPTALSAIRR
ncbi:MAG: hypothetical protein B6A08_05800 [Sorangiineae bacterium NIC37A_2]|nr:MAG: hypothetical protein B6A08_05800 [Sorangiineae bacterium NIC37A_2]